MLNPNMIVKTKFTITDVKTELENITFLRSELAGLEGKVKAVYSMPQWLNTINGKKPEFEKEMKSTHKEAWKTMRNNDEIYKKEWKAFKEKTWIDFLRQKKWEDFMRKYIIVNDSICE